MKFQTVSIPVLCFRCGAASAVIVSQRFWEEDLCKRSYGPDTQRLPSSQFKGRLNSGRVASRPAGALQLGLPEHLEVITPLSASILYRLEENETANVEWRVLMANEEFSGSRMS